MKKKIILIIICILVIGGVFTGGYFIGKGAKPTKEECKEPKKEEKKEEPKEEKPVTNCQFAEYRKNLLDLKDIKVNYTGLNVLNNGYLKSENTVKGLEKIRFKKAHDNLSWLGGYYLLDYEGNIYDVKFGHEDEEDDYRIIYTDKEIQDIGVFYTKGDCNLGIMLIVKKNNKEYTLFGDGLKEFPDPDSELFQVDDCIGTDSDSTLGAPVRINYYRNLMAFTRYGFENDEYYLVKDKDTNKNIEVLYSYYEAYDNDNAKLTIISTDKKLYEIEKIEEYIKATNEVTYINVNIDSNTGYESVLYKLKGEDIKYTMSSE